MSRLSLTTLAVIAVCASSNAQWLSHTTVTPGQSTTATYAGGTGAYSGSVNAVATNIIDGMGNGVPGISPFAHSNLTPTFLSNYPTNPGGTLDYLGVTYNDSGDQYDVMLDFTGLSLGYLPSGSLIAFLDVDISENLRALTAYDPASTQIGSAWLNPIGGLPGIQDFNMTGGDGINNAFLATVSQTGGIYDILGNANNQDSAFQGYTTNQDISRMTWHFNRTVGGIVAGGGGYGVALETSAVPEPASMLTLGVAALGVFARRKRSQR